MIKIDKLPNFDLNRFKKIRCLWGLGNPGASFKKTRHNAGTLLLDYFLQKHGASFLSYKNCDYSVLEFETGLSLILVKFQGYMNNSGEMLNNIQKKFDLTCEEILIVHDELEKSLGKFSFGIGSSKGHNGLKSVFENAGSQDFWRLKIGIGRPSSKSEVANYVLGKFSSLEIETLNSFFEEFFNFVCLSRS